ncbi:Myelin-Associated Glycoprotein [Manis pentadactyla]|nr:Myelin-Associated Glycoprotein [Manis pentadactyla]
MHSVFCWHRKSASVNSSLESVLAASRQGCPLFPRPVTEAHGLCSLAGWARQSDPQPLPVIKQEGKKTNSPPKHKPPARLDRRTNISEMPASSPGQQGSRWGSKRNRKLFRLTGFLGRRQHYQAAAEDLSSPTAPLGFPGQRQEEARTACTKTWQNE